MRRLMLYKDSRNDGELSPQLWLSVLDAIESNNYRKKTLKRRRLNRTRMEEP